MFDQKKHYRDIEHDETQKIYRCRIKKFPVAMKKAISNRSRPWSCHLHLFYPVPVLHHAAHVNITIQSRL